MRRPAWSTRSSATAQVSRCSPRAGRRSPSPTRCSSPSARFRRHRRTLPPRRCSDFPAAQLFVERARLVRPGTVYGEDELLAVGRIARALDGIPLALELAAARVAAMSPPRFPSASSSGSRCSPRVSDGGGATTDVAGDGRLEPRAAHRAGAARLPSPGDLPRRLHAGGSGVRRERRVDVDRSGARHGGPAGRPPCSWPSPGPPRATGCSRPFVTTPGSASTSATRSRRLRTGMPRISGRSRGDRVGDAWAWPA